MVTPLSVILMAGVPILRIHLLLLHRAVAVAEWELHPSLTLLTQLCVRAVKVCAACYCLEIMQVPDQHNDVGNQIPGVCHSFTQQPQLSNFYIRVHTWYFCVSLPPAKF